ATGRRTGARRGLHLQAPRSRRARLAGVRPPGGTRGLARARSTGIVAAARAGRARLDGRAAGIARRTGGGGGAGGRRGRARGAVSRSRRAGCLGLRVTVAPVTYVEAIRGALRRALREDDDVLVLGEDVGLGGGAFRATAGLQAEFGPERVIDTPISEAAFTGAAVGMALDGLRPVVEYQFSDFLTSGMNAIVNTAAKMHFRHRRAVPL